MKNSLALMKGERKNIDQNHFDKAQMSIEAKYEKTVAAIVDKVLPSELSLGEATWLISPGRHNPLLSSRRAPLVLHRIGLLAKIFAIFTPLWGGLDLLFLGVDIGGPIFALRLLAAICFFGLAKSCEAHTEMSWLKVWFRLATLLAIPAISHAAISYILADVEVGGMRQILLTGYTFLPYVLVSALAIFPLTVLESVLAAVPLACACAFGIFLRLGSLSSITVIAELWLFTLLGSVAVMAGAAQMAFLIALVRQALRDPLTRAFSRRSGEELMDIQFLMSCREDGLLCVAFLDIDHFKQINDVYGHQAGDEALASVGASLLKTFRQSDIIIRWGGEEFLLVLPKTSKEGAELAIRRSCMSGGLGKRPDGSAITASIGIAERKEDNVRTWQDLVELADKRMYKVKLNGRNNLALSD